MIQQFYFWVYGQKYQKWDLKKKCLYTCVHGNFIDNSQKV